MKVTILAAALAALSTSAIAQEEYFTLYEGGAWKADYNAGDDGSFCDAYTVGDKGSLSLSFDNYTGLTFMFVHDVVWTKDDTFGLTFHFSNGASYDHRYMDVYQSGEGREPFMGGARLSTATEVDFVADLMTANSVTVRDYWNGKHLGKYSLRGSRRAINTFFDCAGKLD
jgi:hypothetical protein